MNETKKDEKFSKRTKISCIIIFLLIPITLYIGTNYFENRKYMFISMLILFYTMTPFFLIFEERKPKARELILIAGLTAISVAGRVAFFWVPQFKPVLAMTIITGVALGPESGFLVGAMTGFVSNFYFGQGPHTPWQMFTFGLVGFVAGILFKRGKIKAEAKSMAIYGFIASFAIFGLIMNPASIIMFYDEINTKMLLASYISGFPFDLVQAIATVVFLLLIGNPLLEKLERIKLKYGFYEEEV